MQMREAGASAAPNRPRPDNVIEMVPKSGPPRRIAAGARRPIPLRRFGDGKAVAIVERYANYSAIGGAIPIPLANAAAITALMVRMVKSLSELYGGAVRAQPHPLHRHRPDGRRAADGFRDHRDVHADYVRAGPQSDRASPSRR